MTRLSYLAKQDLVEELSEIIDIVLSCDQHSYPLWKGDHIFNSLEEALDYEFSIKICHQGGTIRSEDKFRRLSLENIRSQNCKINFKGSTVLSLHSSEDLTSIVRICCTLT